MVDGRDFCERRNHVVAATRRRAEKRKMMRRELGAVGGTEGIYSCSHKGTKTQSKKVDRNGEDLSDPVDAKHSGNLWERGRYRVVAVEASKR